MRKFNKSKAFYYLSLAPAAIGKLIQQAYLAANKPL
jgi:hypothetical protein